MKFPDVKAFIKNPKRFLAERREMKARNRHHITQTKVKYSVKGIASLGVGDIYCFGFNHRRIAFINKYFPEGRFTFISTQAKAGELAKTKSKILDCDMPVSIWVCGMRIPNEIKPLVKNKSISFFYVEDGFVCSDSNNPDSDVMPFSLAVDSLANHYEGGRPSDIENILSSYDFARDASVVNRAGLLREKMAVNHIGKKLFAGVRDAGNIFTGEECKNYILVVGQPETQASIKNSNDNFELLRLAKQEHPEDIILYKSFDAQVISFSNDTKKYLIDNKIEVLSDELSLLALSKQIKQVYVVKSLVGLDALVRGIPVTTTGCPFYAGWGLTDDRRVIPRRSRKLTLDELIAGTYILYLKYFDPVTGESISPEMAIDKILSMRQDGMFDKKLIPSEIKIFNDKENSVETQVKDKQEVVSKTVTSTKSEVKAQPKPKSAATSGKDTSTTQIAIPDWYNATPGLELKANLQSDKNIFLFIPWIAEHSQSLIAKLDGGNDYVLAALDLVSGLQNDETRRAVSRFARENPALYRQMVVRRLAPLRNKVSGVLFTFDWAAPMRIISSVCLELGIPRILIPHESVFVDRDKYYWDVTGQASLPAADIILGWGCLQKEIFVERGYPAERFHIVGAPKFDSYHNYQPYLEREQFCQLHGLDPDKKIILFAAQPLDSQMDQAQARASQRSAIQDLILYTAEHNLQLLIRTPPSKDAIINLALRQLMDKHNHVAVDNALCYMVTPEETLFHCDVITSINSTMLFEGALLGKPVFSMKYIEFDQIWQKVGIPAVRSYNEFQQLLNEISANNWVQSGIDFSWASSAFGIGEFDGQAATRISAYLSEFAVQPPAKFSQNKPLTRLFNGETVDVVGIPSAAKTLETIQRYLKSLLGARTIVPTQGEIENSTICSVDIFFQWGITPNPHKQQQAKLAKSLGKPVVIIEDGFIRSLDIGLSGEPGLSIILDDVTAYYDATKVSRLSRLLEQGRELTSAELQRAQSAVDKIVGNKVSKYNHAPILPVHIGEPGRKKILLIDQRYGDQSVTSGLADEHTFNRMLQDAINNNPDCDVIIKQHPDAIKGGKSSYFSNERLAFTQHMDNIYLVNYDINPYSLLDLVDDVYVATSGMGFEALMAGKKVHCYGMPFYAGWGLTEDQITLPSRTRNRSLPEVFYFSYIELSRYFEPISNSVVELEDLVEYMSKYR